MAGDGRCKLGDDGVHESMKIIGRTYKSLSALPQAEGLRRAAVHQATGRALAKVSSTGIAKGLYRFRSQAEADEQVAQGLARVMAWNASLQRRRS